MNNLTLIKNKAEALGISVKENEPMKNHTSFKIGGPAELYLTVYNIDQLRDIIAEIKNQNERYMIIGKGTNLLVSDSGIKGVVIELGGDFSDVEINGESITAGAAVSLFTLCRKAMEQSLTGLEFAYGIPGNVGGALFMNAGAYGSEMKDVVVSATHMTEDGTIERLEPSDLDLAYRHSVYHDKSAVILSVEFSLKAGDKKAIEALMNDILGRRKDKQPLDYPSAGSVFKRPEGYFAGALIQQCNLKGRQIGGAMVSPKHAGFIVNAGEATCNDVLSLISLIQQTVKEETGVSLETEVRPIS